MTEATSTAAAIGETAGYDRPAIHFAAKDTWLNDPNGLVHHNGIYHVYYQNNPYGNVWGNMSWGHATSTDLTTWIEHPVAILCDANEDIYSGSIVIDQLNTSGLGSQDCPPWVAVYTSAFKEGTPHQGTQAQSLAFSLDEGMTWTKFAANPVLTRGTPHFRDPKVFWHAGPGGSCWVMVVVEAQEQRVLLYRSANLKDWEYLSDFGPAHAIGGEWECPDLFPLPVDGDPDQVKWVLTVNVNPGAVAGGSGGQYFVGDFDGVTFRQDQRRRKAPSAAASGPAQLRDYDWLDWGRDYYAAVSFSNAPGGRRIMLGWMNNWDYANQTPTSPWRSSMSLAREVTLRTIGGQPVLVQTPILPQEDRMQAAYSSTVSRTLDNESMPIAELPGEGAFLIRAEFRVDQANHVGLNLGVQAPGDAADARAGISFDVAAGELKVDRRESGNTEFHPLFPSVESCPVVLEDGVLALDIIVDGCSLEVFAQQGQASITDLIFPPAGTPVLTVFAEGGTATLLGLTIRSVA